jgi:hypothetical protein
VRKFVGVPVFPRLVTPAVTAPPARPAFRAILDAMPPSFRRLATGALIALLAVTVTAQERDRAKVPDRYKWNLADLYPSDEAWRAAKDQIVKDIPTLATFKGTLTQSARRLADALDAVNRVGKDFQRVALYARLNSDQDMRVSKYQDDRRTAAVDPSEDEPRDGRDGENPRVPEMTHEVSSTEDRRH